MSDSAVAVTDRKLLDRAHNLLSGILRNDYLSDGRGHKRLRKIAAPSLPVKVKFQAKVAESLADELDDAAEDESHDVACEIELVAEQDEADVDDVVALACDEQYEASKPTRVRLSSSEEYRLVRAARGGSTVARDNLIVHNLGLVEMIARRYAHSARMPMDDLVAEGNFGLFEAIKRFDPEYGYRFASYAKWWIRQCIEAAVMSQSRVVRLPVHVTRELRKTRSNDGETKRTNTRFASCLMTDVSNSETSGDSSESLSVLDNMPADDSSSPDFALDQQKQLECLLAALAALCEEDRAILYARFGIGRDEPMTLEDVAKQMGRSGERIRQIQVRATARLREVLLTFGIRDASLDCHAY
jgi:RNA polymerase nonessential primary-like sigma factor